MHLQAYLMSGNEIAQILFLFFLPITVKVRYTNCPVYASFLHTAEVLLNLFPQAKKRPLWCGIGLAITRCFSPSNHEAIRLMKMKFIIRSKFSEFLPSIII